MFIDDKLFFGGGNIFKNNIPFSSGSKYVCFATLHQHGAMYVLNVFVSVLFVAIKSLLNASPKCYKTAEWSFRETNHFSSHSNKSFKVAKWYLENDP